MYLVDTNVISEVRKGERANAGVRRFFQQVQTSAQAVFISVDSLVLEHLRRIRSRVDQIADDVADLKHRMSGLETAVVKSRSDSLST